MKIPKYEVGQKVYFFSENQGKTILANDEVRAVFITKDKVYYSRVSNPHTFGIWLVQEDDIFPSKETAIEFITRPLLYGQGTFNAE